MHKLFRIKITEFLLSFEEVFKNDIFFVDIDQWTMLKEFTFCLGFAKGGIEAEMSS